MVAHRQSREDHNRLLVMSNPSMAGAFTEVFFTRATARSSWHCDVNGRH